MLKRSLTKEEMLKLTSNELVKIAQAATPQTKTLIFDILLKRHRGILHYYARKVQEASTLSDDDFYGEMFLVLCLSVASFKDEKGVQFQTWLTKCLYYRLIDEYKARRCSPKLTSIEEVTNKEELSYALWHDAHIDPAQVVEWRLRIHTFWDALDSRSRLIYKRLSQGTHKRQEIANELGCSNSMITYWVSRGKIAKFAREHELDKIPSTVRSMIFHEIFCREGN